MKKINTLTKNNILLLIFFIVSISYYLFIVYLEKNEIQSYKNRVFLDDTRYSKKYLNELIKEKQNAIRSIILSISKDTTLISDIENKKDIRLDLKDISKKLKINTDFKNLWFQVIDKNGNSLQRSWTNKKGDSLLNKRIDVKSLLKNPRVEDVISIGIFDLTMKSIIPIYGHKNDFLGLIEIISHFNSISKKLSKKSINLVTLVNKEYSKQLKYPFSKKFLQEHYVANINVDPLLLLQLDNYNIEDIVKKLNKKEYIILEELNLLVTSQDIISSNKTFIGTSLLFKDISTISLDNIVNIENRYNLYNIIGIFMIIFLYYLITKFNTTKEDNKSSLKIMVYITTVFIVLSLGIYIILNNIYKTNISNYIENKKNRAISEYQDIYNQNYNIANVVYEFIVKDKKTLELFKDRKREELIRFLQQRYLYIKDKFDVRQLHFHLKDSSSYIRMHKLNKYGDSLKGIRESVEYVNDFQKPFDGFEEGRIVNGFRFVYPVFYKDEHIGSVEVSFSGLSFLKKYINTFKYKNIELLISKDVIDEKIFNSEKNHYIKSFIDEFYLEKEIVTVKNNKEYSYNIKKYYKDTAKKIYKGKPFVEHIPELNKFNIYIPLVNKLSNKSVGTIYISTNDIYLKEQYIHFLIYLIFLLIILLILMVFIYKEIISKRDLRISKDMTQTILDSQESLIFLINKNKIVSGNNSFFRFFDIKDIKNFNDTHNSISNLLLDKNSINNNLTKFEDNISLINYFLKNHKDNILTITNPKTKQEHIFNLYIKKHIDDENLIIISLIDITDIKNMEKQVLESEKMASMGEMIGNIAHQWRQPLSIISTSATGMAMKKEFGVLEDEEFFKNCEHINLNAQYLSKTIDDFRDYIKGDQVAISFNLKETILSFLTLLDATIKDNNISIILDLDEKIVINGFPKELVQCFINILNNSKDAFKERDIKQRYFFISSKIEDDEIIINLKDNAGGIPNNIISKIFEPYFTTKHKSIGTGIGLHMTYDIINKSMKGNISVSNSNYEYKQNEQKGAEFIIKLPLKL